jgi:predicted metalloprotease with PDZ domain
MIPIDGSGAARRRLICLLFAVAAFPFSTEARSVGARSQRVEAEPQRSQAKAQAAEAPAVEASIEVVSLSPPRVKIHGRRESAATSWSFRNAHAGMLGLAGRVENFTLADENESGVPVRKLAPGEYESARPATRFAYEVRLDPPADNNNAAHVSWLAPTHGLLMTGDLLPLPHGRARLHLILPPGWQTAAPLAAAPGTFGIEDAESAVLLVGTNVRQQRAKVRGSNLTVALAGDWAFGDKEAVELVTQIFNEHARSFGGSPQGDDETVIIAPHPLPSNASQWSAETRGGTVTLLTGRAPTRQSALARLAGPLTHELFHLWVPNGLNLSGDYDWFYEGFANYQALRAGLRLGHLNFGDYLDALARTYDSYGRESPRDDVSLVDASSRRWSGSNALVYHKGALVAFLYDLELRRRTDGKRTLDDALRELFRRNTTSAASADGNTAVAEALEASLGVGDFTRRYVRSVHRIDLAEELRPYGLTVITGQGRTRIAVSESLSGSQRALLRQIGYN